MANDPYTDDEYDDTYRELHGDEPARDEYVDDRDDGGFFPYGMGWGYWPAGWGLWPAGDTVDADQEYDEREEYGYDRTEGVGAEDEDEGTWLDEGLIATLLIVGLVLFLFPEPATSAVGIAMLAVGAVAWIVDWMM